MAARKKVTAPIANVARVDPEVIEELFQETPASHSIEVADAQERTPALVLELARRVGEEPWTWYMGADFVSIVMMSGKKYRFERLPQ